MNVLQHQNIGKRRPKTGSQTKNVLLRGGNFSNKGDQLMFQAVVQRLAGHQGIRLVSVPHMESHQDRLKLGVDSTLWNPRSRNLYARVRNGFLRACRFWSGRVTDDEISAVLDFSGFAYGDQWGAANTLRLARYMTYLKSKVKDIVFVMLPQAFGPFQSRDVREAMKTVLENVDLAFARDRESFAHLQEVGGGRAGIRLAPDFTNLVAGNPPSRFLVSAPRACIVPNVRMIDNKSSTECEEYYSTLAFVAQEMKNRGINPFFLLHTDRLDEHLVAPICSRISFEIPVVREQDPLLLKGILGGCVLVVGSRFHALIGALSQAVPAIGFGWSHKYEMLFQEYECAEFLLSPATQRNDICRVIAAILEEPSRSEVIKRLKRNSAKQIEETVRMWEFVEHFLGCSRP